MMARPRIFVSIACFRDPECQHTVQDLFAKASYPEHVFVGICWQFHPELDRDCFVMPPQFPQQIRTKHYRAEDSLGSCWARAEALSLYEGEEYESTYYQTSDLLLLARLQVLMEQCA